MDDQIFFAKLREIQKKERANSSLARVDNFFYKKIYKYLNSVRTVARNDPFSEEGDLLKNVQRIVTEICEIREHKIVDAAVMNIHRSYHLFQGKPQFDLDTTPLNITAEEENLYFSFIDVLKNHRKNITIYTDSDPLNDNNNLKKSSTELQRKSQTKNASNSRDKRNTNKNNNSNIKNNKDTNNATVNVVTNLSTENNNMKQKSKIFNILRSEDEQFVNLDQLYHDIEYHNLDDNSLNRINSKSTVDKIVHVMILIFSEINSITGVDKKIYGPFHPQDIVIMPDINAKILIKNKKGRLVKNRI